MALIKCPECGNMISDMASNCPKCGCPVGNAGMQRKRSTTRVLNNDNERTRVIYKKNNNTNKWLYAIIALLASILVGGGTYYFLNKEKDKDTQATAMAKDTPTTITTPANLDEDEPATPPAPAKIEEPATTPTPVKQEEPATTPTPAKQEEPISTPPPVQRNKVADGTYSLNGSIKYKDTYYIDMEIHVRGNKVTGWHIVHNGENIRVNLSGSIDANGNMKLTEYKGGSTTGYYYTGNFNQVTYSGKYLCTFKNLPMSFSASTY
ncbi:MAG: hypothetical protein IKH88_10665 [Prevotella sp.]|nr:hypothetical protein [Prevotella sp.]